MSLSACLIGLVLVSIIASVCLITILIYCEPVSSGAFVFILFYLSLLASSTAILTLIGWFIRRISRKRRFPLQLSQAIRQLEVSFRQGILLAAILIAALILQSQRTLMWWNLLVLIGLVGLSEWWLAKK